MKNDRGTGHRGFGFVDFEDRESLISALCKNEVMLLTRPVRVNLKEHTGGGGERGSRSDGPQKSDMDNDWRKREPQNNDEEGGENSEYKPRDFYQHDQRDQRTGGYHNRNYNRNRGDQRPSYNQDRNSGDQRPSYNQDRNSGEQGNWNERRNYRQKQNYDGGENRSERPRYGSGRQSTGEYRNRPQQQRNYEHEFNRSHENPEPEVFTSEGAPNPVPELPKERPKLNLQPRTKPIESPEVAESAASIFGGAKPVDTAARERAIEEKIKAAEVSVKSVSISESIE